MIALQYFRKKAKLTQAQLADKIGISRSALAMWEIGTTEPDISKLKSLCSVLNVSERDLLINVSEWHSDMFEDFYNAKSDEEKLAIFRCEGVPENLIPTYQNLMNELSADQEESFVPVYDNILPLKTKKVPLLGDIACGEPIWAEEQYGEFVSVSEDIDADFCVRARGDSMTGARIYDGDIVFIRQQATVENGEIAAVIIDNEATLKRVYYYPDKHKLVLNPENPAFEPFVYIDAELDEVRILGKAVAFQSLVR